jgi:hypothetical protein
MSESALYGAKVISPEPSLLIGIRPVHSRISTDPGLLHRGRRYCLGPVFSKSELPDGTRKRGVVAHRAGTVTATDVLKARIVVVV